MASALQLETPGMVSPVGDKDNGSNERTGMMTVCRRKVFYHLRVNVLPTVSLVTALVLAMAWLNS
jgi:hypothetical protein